MKCFAWLVMAWPLAAGPVTVIRNATVLTITKGTFQGSILIRDGKIVETPIADGKVDGDSITFWSWYIASTIVWPEP